MSMEDASIPLVPAPRALLGLSQSELSAWAERLGQPAYRGRQIHEWLYTRGIRSLTEVTVLPKPWRAQVAAVPVGRSELHYRSVASDDTVKYLLRLSDGETVETVGIPTAQRLTVCVSSQVGCPMACDFCATGKSGLQRNLDAHEIVDQILTVQEDFQRRVGNIVFMGMGEPLLNTEQVVKAVHCLNREVGISQRGMTISTVGIPGQIRRLAEHQLQVTLAVSLHASNQLIRERLIPSARKYPLTELLAECQAYVTSTGRRVSFEYILLAGLNDEPEHAAELASHLRGFQSHVNLIPYNPIAEVDYQRPSTQRVQRFVQALKDRHVAVSVRQTRGLEADAACGQLRRRQTAAS